MHEKGFYFISIEYRGISLKNYHHLITQHDNIHARTHHLHVDARGYMTSGTRAQIVVKIAKLSHIIGARGDQGRLIRSPSLIMASDFRDPRTSVGPAQMLGARQND